VKSFLEISAIEYLIGTGATINVPGQRTPLHEACCTGGLAAVKILLKKYGAAVNIADHRGRIPLHDAAAHFEPEIVSVLLLAGADPAIKDWEEQTPLDLARRYEDNESVINILEECVIHHITTAPGATAGSAEPRG
jgi:ankyrin repeat protein